MSTGLLPVLAPDVQTPRAAPLTVQPVSPSFDERWDAWQAKGAAHDRAVRRKLAIAAPIVAVVAAALFYAVVVR
jgi:small-conductance mechanosensitive channel